MPEYRESLPRRTILGDLVDRGRDFSKPRLYILDGGKALTGPEKASWRIGCHPALEQLVSADVQRPNDCCGDDAVDAEKVPASAIEPPTEPPESDEPGQKCEDGSQQAGH